MDPIIIFIFGFVCGILAAIFLGVYLSTVSKKDKEDRNDDE